MSAWRPVVGLMAGIGLAVAMAVFAVVPRQPSLGAAEAKSAVQDHDAGGFGLLLTIGALGTAIRMGYLLFLPFLLHARGATGGVGRAFAVF